MSVRIVLSLLILSIMANPQISDESQGIEEKIEVIDLYESLPDEVLPDEALPQEASSEKFVEIIKFNPYGLILREGIAGEEVLRIKQFLKEKGYDNITDNYSFDQDTKAAIMDYQMNNGLVADGIIGINTYDKINCDMEINGIFIPNKNMEFLSQVPDGSWIIINKNNNTLLHLDGTDILGRYPVATGKSLSFTPEGKFTIVTKYVNPSWGGAGIYAPVKGGAPNNPLGKRWMGLSINGGGWYGIHGNADNGSIGRYISLGCIRMFNEDVEYLYEIIEKGTPVWIGSEEKLQEYGVYFNQ